ncbi:hypothetical protein G8759_27545 [Spirosoma aureum]|uniref:Uncharacterized protein n=1 Tax=Spirosoma aureum TaxID=2692134 RepID=A0A6G9AUF8_9BACT|nr:hypothetical protein [Spirosoma aureum]QIP16122.1 hypothetical protein G8759_27545 [Spirosoma aureum]
MLRRLPPIIQFIFVCMIGICMGTLAGFLNECTQQPFSAANALIWLFLMIVSGSIVTLIILYSRNGLR